MPVTLLAAFMLGASPAARSPVVASYPASGESRHWRDGMPRPPEATPPPTGKRFFGIGVSFQNRGGAEGIALDLVVTKSPAERVGFVSGMIVTEIEGHATMGRTGDDCRRMVSDAGASVTIKYFDPLTFKLRSRVVKKEWFPMPNL